MHCGALRPSVVTVLALLWVLAGDVPIAVHAESIGNGSQADDDSGRSGTVPAEELGDVEGLADSIDAFLEGALRININARIVDSGNEALWTMDLTRVTIGGRSVRVRLDGANIVVVADFTPYWESEDELLLVAQGQTWITGTDAEEETTYRTSFTTLPIRLNEPIVFLPLGPGVDEDLDTDHLGQLNIELEIFVERYQS